MSKRFNVKVITEREVVLEEYIDDLYSLYSQIFSFKGVKELEETGKCEVNAEDKISKLRTKIKICEIF